MKNIFLTGVVALAMGGTLVSCNDFLNVDPEDKPVMETFYTSPENLRTTTMTLYASKTWSNFHMNFQWKMDMLAGDLFYTYSEEGQWYFGNYTTTNPYINEGWKGLYNVILFANSIINDIPPVCGGTITEDDIKKATAEARGMRGYCYYMLTEVWRDVPIVENNSETIASGKYELPRATQASVYRFAMEDLDYAVENLPDQDNDSYRLDKRKARALRSKLAVTMAQHSDLGYNRDELYKKAADDALFVIENTQALTQIDFSKLFDVESNNGPESILAIQCAVQGYSFGNAHNVAWSRSSVIADQTWGAGKGPTLSLQAMYDKNDKRRMWTYMTNGDYYPNLNKAGGGYTYQYVSRDGNGDVLEDRNEMLAHIKKYIIGKGADCDGNVGINQDAANNIYLMRLADVYLTYVEAVMGAAESTSDATAMKYFNMVRQRAGIPELNSVTYKELMKERRRELAFESQTWFDIQRFRYRAGTEAALEWINSGFETGINRCAMYQPKNGVDQTTENNLDSYKVVSSKEEGGQYDAITIQESAFQAPLPAAVTSSSPMLLQDPIDYYAE